MFISFMSSFILTKNLYFHCFQIADGQTTREINRLLKGRYFTVKLDIKTHNIGQKESSYHSSGIYEVVTEDTPSKMDTSRITNANQESMTQVKRNVHIFFPNTICLNICQQFQASGSTYHLDDLSQLNFNSPEVNQKKNKRISKKKIK